MTPVSQPLRTPYFLVDEARLMHNLEILRDVQERAGCKILLAQKAFSMFSVYPLLRQYLAGSTASGLYEARLGGPTCLAGDVIGDYSFDAPLREGDRLVFEDMALYTMVKTNTFNGMPLPSIVWRDKDGALFLVRSFGYEDFKTRLS